MQLSQEKNKETTTHKSSTPESRLLTIKREFQVPVSQLFKSFTTAEALKIWWWPKTLWADRVDWDFREGGTFFIDMKGFVHGGGMVGTFETIIPNELLVMSDQFSDKDGNVISAQEAQMPGVWPEFVYITFEFESVGENKSRFILSQEGIPNESQKDCVQGWSESFDKLQNYLENRKQ